MITIGYPTTCKANGKGKHFVKVNVQDCKFPFIYDGKKYNGCTTTGTKYGPWCATKVRNKNGVYNDWDRSKAKTGGPGITGKYNVGICDDGVDSKCTIPPKRNFKL